MHMRTGRVTRRWGSRPGGQNGRWSGWLACCLALAVALQGFTVVAQRVAPGGHFHVAPIGFPWSGAHGHDDHHADRGTGHFHAAIGHHEHATHDLGVVYVDEDETPSGEAMTTTGKRVASDLEQLAGIAAPPAAMPGSSAPLLPRPHAVASHVAERLERPPRLSAI